VIGAEVALHVLASVTVTVNVSDAVTLIVCDVAPFDQRYEVKPAPASSVTLPPVQNVSGPLCVIDTIGAGLTVTVVGDDVPLQVPSLTVTVNVSLLVTLIDCEVAPFDQRYDTPALAVRVTLPPSQNVVGPDGVIVGIGVVTAVTLVTADVALQPAASVTVTLNVPVPLTLIDCVVSALDQRYDAPAFAVSVTLPPRQKVVGPDGVIVAVGVETLTVTLFDADGQDVTKTVTPKVTGSVVPASNVIVSDVVEEVIVPFEIVQAYVPPGTIGVDAA
jgi:hypothetical protein